MKKKKMLSWYQGLSIQTKLLMTFALTAVLMFVINIILYSEINRSMIQLDEVYATNVSLNELAECLEHTHEEVYEYLNTKSTVSLENYYRNVQELKDMLEQLNDRNTGSQMKMQEKNIRGMSETYLEIADQTVQAKRGRNAERYNDYYNEASRTYKYVQSAIYRLNDIQFRSNSNNYQIMLESLQYLEIISSAIVIVVAVINLMILVLLTRSITEPLRLLARSANEVAAGNFEWNLPETESRDEVGIVTHAFVKMVRSIREYIQKTKESLEKERQMKERELLMETHLKDAQLKYLQAQINPHFLFNSLNAGAQLALMEDAEKTSIFIEKMADFFRYNVRKTEEPATLEEELEAVDSYVYILNVRFAGEIHYEKEVYPGLENLRMPSMILQPLVENAVNHGIRGVEREGHIWLTAEPQGETVHIQIRDNGEGMTKERLEAVREGQVRHGGGQGDSTGIGLDNVISRLELFFGEKDLFQITSPGPDQGTSVDLWIPLKKEAKGI